MTRDHTEIGFLCPSCSDELWFGQLSQAIMKCWCLRCGLAAQQKGGYLEVFAAICHQHDDLIQKSTRCLAA